MKKKLIIILIIILLLIMGTLTYIFLFQEKQFEVGISSFTLPNGYYEGNMNNDGATNLTNGTHSIFVSELKDKNAIEYMDEYEEYKNSQNYATKSSNFTLDKTLVYKVDVINDTGNVHYWFEHNGKTYCIYTWTENPNMDTITLDLIKSAGYTN